MVAASLLLLVSALSCALPLLASVTTHGPPAVYNATVTFSPNTTLCLGADPTSCVSTLDRSVFFNMHSAPGNAMDWPADDIAQFTGAANLSVESSAMTTTGGWDAHLGRHFRADWIAGHSNYDAARPGFVDAEKMQQYCATEVRPSVRTPRVVALTEATHIYIWSLARRCVRNSTASRTTTAMWCSRLATTSTSTPLVAAPGSCQAGRTTRQTRPSPWRRRGTSG